MRCIVKAFRRPPTARIRNPQRDFPIGGPADNIVAGELAGRLSGSVAHAFPCPALPRRALLAENLAKPLLWVMVTEPWYKPAAGWSFKIPKTFQKLNQKVPF